MSEAGGEPTCLPCALRPARGGRRGQRPKTKQARIIRGSAAALDAVRGPIRFVKASILDRTALDQAGRYCTPTPPNPCWRPRSSDRADGSGGRHPGPPHPDPSAALGRPKADHDAGSVAAPARKPSCNETLVKALGRARRWRRRIESGQAKSITDLAEQERVTVAYVCRLLPLKCLAPDVVEAILDGRQPKERKATELLGNGPLVWEDQRRRSAGAAAMHRLKGPEAPPDCWPTTVTCSHENEPASR